MTRKKTPTQDEPQSIDTVVESDGIGGKRAKRYLSIPQRMAIRKALGDLAHEKSVSKFLEYLEDAINPQMSLELRKNPEKVRELCEELSTQAATLLRTLENMPQGVRLEFEYEIGPVVTYRGVERSANAMLRRLREDLALLQEVANEVVYITPAKGKGVRHADWYLQQVKAFILAKYIECFPSAKVTGYNKVIKVMQGFSLLPKRY